MSIIRPCIDGLLRFSPLLLEQFNKRKRAVTGKWHVDETYIKVRGRWMYLYRAIDSVGDTVEFWFSEHRDLPAAKRFFRKALDAMGAPIVSSSMAARPTGKPSFPAIRPTGFRTPIATPEPIRIRASKYFNNRIEQDHRRIKRRIRPMLGFKSLTTANSHSVRDRTGSHDAQTTGEICL